MKLLIIGPMPPPLTGTPVSFQILCNELKQRPEIEDLRTVDSSPRHLKQAQSSSLLRFGDVRQAVRVLFGFVKHVARVDKVLVFGSNGSIATILPVLLVLCKAFRKPCYFRVFGGSLDWYFAQIGGRKLKLATWSASNVEALVVQTELLRRFLREELGLAAEKVGVLPGYRVPPEKVYDGPKQARPGELKLAFFGIVKPEKGVPFLLEAMSMAQDSGLESVSCDIYGSVVDGYEAEFLTQVDSLDSVEYRGLLGWELVVEKLREYDALVLPSSYIGEGHPGVIIEAMLAGITVISTDFRSIPELVDHEVNGLLVAPENAEGLLAAFKRLLEPGLLASLSCKNWERGENHLASTAANSLIDMLEGGPLGRSQPLESIEAES